MGKYDKSIEVLQKALMEVGGRLYAIELAKQNETSAFMLEMFSSLVPDISIEDLNNLKDAIKLLTDNNNSASPQIDKEQQ